MFYKICSIFYIEVTSHRLLGLKTQFNPIFTHKVASRHLSGNKNVKKKNVFSTSPLHSVGAGTPGYQTQVRACRSAVYLAKTSGVNLLWIIALTLGARTTGRFTTTHQHTHTMCVEGLCEEMANGDPGRAGSHDPHRPMRCVFNL